MGLKAAFFGLTAVLGAGCDVGTKVWAEERLGQLPDHTMRLIEPWLDLRLEYNPGTAFSLITDLGVARAFFGVFALLVVFGLLYASLRGQLLHVLALGLIAGGAIGNGIDRIFRVGVIDFIVFNYPGGGSWPTFNVADALVAIGAGLLIAEAFRSRRADPEAPPGEGTPDQGPDQPAPRPSA